MVASESGEVGSSTGIIDCWRALEGRMGYSASRDPPLENSYVEEANPDDFLNGLSNAYVYCLYRVSCTLVCTRKIVVLVLTTFPFDFESPGCRLAPRGLKSPGSERGFQPTKARSPNLIMWRSNQSVDRRRWRSVRTCHGENLFRACLLTISGAAWSSSVNCR